MKTNPNDAAFARPTTDVHSTNLEEIAQTGLTKREYFAAMALSGLSVQAIAGRHNDFTVAMHAEQQARCAVSLADALIAELNKEQK